MKPTQSNRRTKAMTLVEVVVVVVVSAFLVLILFATFRPAYSPTKPIICARNLMEIGFEFKAWADDNNGKFPMQASITNGWVMDLAVLGDAAAVFQVMSNEISNPKILVCPNDPLHRSATNWTTDFGNEHISYFVGLDVTEQNPNSILAGDDNFEINGTEVKSGMLQLTTNTPIAWTIARHHLSGSIALADGSVVSQPNSGLTRFITNQYAGSSGFTNRFRLAIP